MQTKRDTFLITGASSGLGLAVTEKLIVKNCNLILVARREEILKEIKRKHPDKIQIYSGDLLDSNFISKTIKNLPSNLSGVFINAGGPPASNFNETSIDDWHNGYNLLIKWKVELLKGVLPILEKNKKGKIIFSESNSITKPIENLLLSNSLRMSIIGLMKSLVLEYSKYNITFNILAPGYHETNALDRIYKKFSLENNISIEEAKDKVKNSIRLGMVGNAADYADLATWIFTENSGYITGQIINIDGGVST